MKLKFVGSTKFPTYQNLSNGKVYDVISISTEENGENWVLLKNDLENEVEYNAQFFEEVS